MEVRGQLMGVCRLISSRGGQGPNSGNMWLDIESLYTLSPLTGPHLLLSGPVLAI